MDIREVRLACIQAAVATQGNPNKLDLAEQYFQWVEAAVPAAPKQTDDTPEKEASVKTNTNKGKNNK